MTDEHEEFDKTIRDYFDQHDDTAVVALVHIGRDIQMHVVVQLNRQAMKYEVRVDDDVVVEGANTQNMAMRLADMFLLGFINGFTHQQDAHNTEPDDPDPHVHKITRQHIHDFGRESHEN